MAENVLITPGSGDTVAADEIAGVKHQRVKITIGADGVNDGDVSSANPLPVSTSITSTVAIKAADGTFAVYFSPSTPSVSVPVVQRVQNVVDGTLSSVTRVSNLIDGTLSVVTFIPTVQRVQNLVDGTLTTVTGVDRIRNLVDGTISTVSGVTTVTRVDRVMNLVDGTLSTVNRVQNVVDGTLSTIGRVNHLIDGTVTVTGITASIAVFFDRATPNVAVLNNAQPIGNSGVVGSTTQRVVHATDVATSMNIMGVGTLNTLSVFIPDTGHTIGKVDAGAGTFTFKTDPGYELGSIKGINSSINVYLGATAGTLSVQLKPGALLASMEATAGVFTVSGTTSTAGNNTLVSPSASYNFKVFAYSVQTTGIVSCAPRFTTGASAGATELWRPLINAVQTTSTPIGANMSVPGESFIFATGTNTTLSLYLDTGTLIHYSVSYRKESA